MYLMYASTMRNRTEKTVVHFETSIKFVFLLPAKHIYLFEHKGFLLSKTYKEIELILGLVCMNPTIFMQKGIE